MAAVIALTAMPHLPIHDQQIWMGGERADQRRLGFTVEPGIPAGATRNGQLLGTYFNRMVHP